MLYSGLKLLVNLMDVHLEVDKLVKEWTKCVKEIVTQDIKNVLLQKLVLGMML
jgi:hypothetical protein